MTLRLHRLELGPAEPLQLRVQRLELTGTPPAPSPTALRVHSLALTGSPLPLLRPFAVQQPLEPGGSVTIVAEPLDPGATFDSIVWRRLSGDTPVGIELDGAAITVTAPSVLPPAREVELAAAAQVGSETGPEQRVVVPVNPQLRYSRLPDGSYVGVSGPNPPATRINVPPTATFSINVSDRAVLLDASGSTDDVRIVEWWWDFGDGTGRAASSGPTGAHVYDRDGTFTITLTVFDEDGASATASGTVDIAAPVPEPEPAPEPIKPNPVTDLRATAVTETAVALAWTLPTNAPIENLRIRVNGAYEAQISRTATSYTVTGLVPATEYVLSVQVYGEGGWTNTSTQARVTVSTSAPAAPAPPRPPVVVGFSPPQLTNPVVRAIRNSDVSISLDATRDYILEGREVITRNLSISGGRRVQVMGLEMDNPGGTRSLYIQHQRESVWVEGFNIYGEGLKEGIDGHHGAGADVFLINGRVAHVQGEQAGHHADVIQQWAMARGRTYHVERLEGSSNYQGLMWQPGQFGDPTATVRMRKVLFRMQGKTGYPIFDGDFATTTWDLEDVFVVSDPPKADPYWPHNRRPQGIQTVTEAAAPASFILGKPGLGYVSPGYGSGVAQLFAG